MIASTQSVSSRKGMTEVIRHGGHNAAILSRRDKLTSVDVALMIGYLLSIKK
jgi:hypothetical protein